MLDSASQLPGKFLFFSGKTGMVLKSVPLPGNARTYFTPVIYLAKNGTELVVFATGGGTKNSGDLYVIQLSELFKGEIDKAVKLASNKKGW